MKYLILFILAVAIAGGVYLTSQNSNTLPNLNPSPKGQTGSLKITPEQAVEKVKNLPEVQQFLKDVPNGIVEVDNEPEEQYNVHVYEIKNGHTATFNWYTVNVKDGKIKAQFEITTKGTVSGKLCYPSEVLPPGKIESKRLSDGKISTQDYPGSLNGGKNIYTFELEKGDYYLRYNIQGAGNFIGYSTTVCPTGNEETCGDKKPRELIKATVEPGGEVTNYNLCDFYYQASNAPKF